MNEDEAKYRDLLLTLDQRSQEAYDNLFVQQHLTDPRECSGRQRLGEVEQAEADGEAHDAVAAFGDAIETTAGDFGHKAVTAQLGDDAADARAATLRLQR